MIMIMRVRISLDRVIMKGNIFYLCGLERILVGFFWRVRSWGWGLFGMISGCIDVKNILISDILAFCFWELFLNRSWRNLYELGWFQPITNFIRFIRLFMLLIRFLQRFTNHFLQYLDRFLNSLDIKIGKF